jgi:hypothetical protein
MQVSQIRFGKAPVKILVKEDQEGGFYYEGEVWSLSSRTVKAVRLQPSRGWSPIPPKAGLEVEVIR